MILLTNMVVVDCLMLIVIKVVLSSYRLLFGKNRWWEEGEYVLRFKSEKGIFRIIILF